MASSPLMWNVDRSDEVVQRDEGLVWKSLNMLGLSVARVSKDRCQQSVILLSLANARRNTFTKT